MTQLIISDRSNASRKAKLMIAKGEAPASQFIIEKRGEREYEVVWLTGSEPDSANHPRPLMFSADWPPPSEAAPLPVTEPEEPEEVTPLSASEIIDAEIAQNEAKLKADKRASKAAGRQAKAEARKARIQASQAAAAPPSAPSKPAKRGPHNDTDGKRFYSPRYITQNLARGTMPVKPIIASATNQAYQRHIDALAKLAEEGKWQEIATYEVSQSKQSYATILRKYHEQLLAARPTGQRPAPPFPRLPYDR